MQWDPDRILQTRMAVVIGLLAVMPAAFVVVMDWAIANVIVPMLAVFFDTRTGLGVHREPAGVGCRHRSRPG
jgi:hypothetical protein